MSDCVVFWDFDGTLAQRPGLWSGCVLEVLDEAAAGHAITLDEIRAGLTDGFPWHRHEVAHPELCDPEAWWASVGMTLTGGLTRAGMSRAQASEMVSLVRARYADPTVGWELFDDTLPALRATAEAGWRNVVLSNHVPELPALVSGLGLDDHIEAVFSSALTGYEKPHPEAYRRALRECGNPTVAFMVGDNPVADVAGAEAVGLPAVLVRRTGVARHQTEGLAGATAIILSSTDAVRR